MQVPTFDDVASAHRRLSGHVVRTPMLRNALLDQLTGGTILIKPETLQRTGSFKLRGATNAALQLTRGATPGGSRDALVRQPWPGARLRRLRGWHGGDDLHAEGRAAGEGGEHAALGGRRSCIMTGSGTTGTRWRGRMPSAPAPR